MRTLTKPIRDEHRALAPEIDLIRSVADWIGEADEDRLGDALGEIASFLRRRLLPHAAAEETYLYPVVERIMGATGTTASMQRDHVEIARLAGEIDALRRQPGASPGGFHERALRRVLYGLHALVRLHFDKEEALYLPLLDHALSEAEAHDLFERMERASGGAVAS